MRTFLNVIAVIAALPSALFLLAAMRNVSDAGESGGMFVVAVLWGGFVYFVWWLLTRAVNKAEEAVRFTADQMERRTRAMEQQVDAETIGHVAGAGQHADESETARRWTKRTDAFGRIVGDDDDDAELIEYESERDRAAHVAARITAAKAEKEAAEMVEKDLILYESLTREGLLRELERVESSDFTGQGREARIEKLRSLLAGI